MNGTTQRMVNVILKNEWFRKSQTLGEGGWKEIYSSGIEWKTYVLYEEKETGEILEVEAIMASNDITALEAFKSLYFLEKFNYWEIQERIVEYRLIEMKK